MAQKMIQVAVVGGGVGGLAAGVALRQRDIDCVVYERDEHFESRKNGYGMTLSSDENGPVAKLGILERCRDLDCVSTEHWTFDGDGNVLGYFGRGLSGGDDEKRRRGSLRIQRQQLRRVLLERYEALGGRVVWGKSLIKVVEEDQVVYLDFADGSTVCAAVVVGADGIRSIVRSFLFASPTQDSALSQVGISAIVGISSFQHSLLQRRGFYVVDGMHRLFTMPFDQDLNLSMWQLTFPSALFHDAPKVIAKRIFDSWRGELSTMCSHLLAETHDAVWAVPSLLDRDQMPPRSRSQRSHITVLGDACHPMTFFKGQGANQALSDAHTLAKCLDLSRISTSLRIFEREMVQRAAPRALASRHAAHAIHSGDHAIRESMLFSGFGGNSHHLAQTLKRYGVSAATPNLLSVVRNIMLTSTEHLDEKEYQQHAPLPLGTSPPVVSSC